MKRVSFLFSEKAYEDLGELQKLSNRKKLSKKDLTKSEIIQRALKLYWFVLEQIEDVEASIEFERKDWCLDLK